MEKLEIINFLRENLFIEVDENYTNNYGDMQKSVTIKLCILNEKGERETISQESFSG